MADTESNGRNEWQLNTDFCVQFVISTQAQSKIYIYKHIRENYNNYVAIMLT